MPFGRRASDSRPDRESVEAPTEEDILWQLLLDILRGASTLDPDQLVTETMAINARPDESKERLVAYIEAILRMRIMARLGHKATDPKPSIEVLRRIADEIRPDFHKMIKPDFDTLDALLRVSFRYWKPGDPQVPGEIFIIHGAAAIGALQDADLVAQVNNAHSQLIEWYWKTR